MTTTDGMLQVKQGDVLRYMLLYKYGGMYLDMDVECFAAADDSLGDYTIVLQGTGIEGVTNAVMASAPNNTFWLEVLRTCQERADKPEFKIAIQATGPKAVGATIKRLFDVDPFNNIGFVGKDLEVSTPFYLDSGLLRLLLGFSYLLSLSFLLGFLQFGFLSLPACFWCRHGERGLQGFAHLLDVKEEEASGPVALHI